MASVYTTDQLLEVIAGFGITFSPAEPNRIVIANPSHNFPINTRPSTVNEGGGNIKYYYIEERGRNSPIIMYTCQVLPYQDEFIKYRFSVNRHVFTDEEFLVWDKSPICRPFDVTVSSGSNIVSWHQTDNRLNRQVAMH
jgi:hypothetical protein